MEQYIPKSDLVAEIERLVNNQDSALDYEAALEDVRNFLDTLEVKYLQEEPTFKVGDRIRIKGTTVKGDVIKNIYQAEGGNTYFEFENSDDALANEMWELVEDHKEFKPIRKKQPEGVLKELLDNMDEKELEDTRKEMLKEEPVSEDIQKAGSLKSFEYYPEKKTTNTTGKGVFDANMPRRKAYLRGFKDGAHAHKVLLDNKPVNEELEEEIEKYFNALYRNWTKEDRAKDSDVEEMCRQTARHFADWQKEQDKQWLAEEHKNIFAKGRDSMKQQMIQKACDWQKENLLNYTYSYNGEVGIGMAEFLKHFSKAMKD